MIDCGCDEILLPQGSDGVNGKNAFTVTTASFVQPAALSNVTITVSDSLQNTNQWAIPGQIIRVTDASGNGGWYQVVSITGTTQILVTNLDYTGSSTAGLTIATGAGVSPAGLRGPNGDPGNPGNNGDPGPPNTLSIDATNTLQPGTPAYVTIAGPAPNQTLTFGIPKGESGATLHHSYLIDTVSPIAPSTTGGNLFPAQVFAADTLCPSNGSAARIKGSFLLNGTGVKDAARIITNISFLIGDQVNPAAVISPSPTSAGKTPGNFQINESGDYCYFKFEILIQRLSFTQSFITVEWTYSGMGGDNRTRTYIGSSVTTGSLNFNPGSVAEFIIKYDTPVFTSTLEARRRGLIVEKITA
jgi:hypothetical protein